MLLIVLHHLSQQLTHPGSLFFIGSLLAGYEASITAFVQKNYRLLAFLSVPVFLLFYTVSVCMTGAFPYQTQDMSVLSVRMLQSWYSLLWQSLAVISFCAISPPGCSTIRCVF